MSWKKILFKAMIWLTAEIFLNFIGLDDLADYSEFIFEKTVRDPRISIINVASVRESNIFWNLLNTYPVLKTVSR